MSGKKYVVPMVMGKPSTELFLMRGSLQPGQKAALVRLVTERGVVDKDERGIRALINSGKLMDRPTRIKEVEVMSEESLSAVTPKEAALIYGYIHNTLPGAFKSPEMTKWFLYEKPNDVTPLKMARFSINLLSKSECQLLAGWMSAIRMETDHKQLATYR